MKNMIFYNCFVIVVAGYIPISASDSWKRQTVNDNNGQECSRSCAQNVDDVYKSRTCMFKFFVGRAINRDGTSMQRVINGTSPGPPIEICLGDTVEVIVENGLSSEELSFHWHGLRQMGSPHMDGVSMISQCPIMPYTSFRYEIRPESIGTYFYHAHSVRQQGDGLYGSLIVRGPRDNPTTEIVLLVSAKPSSPLSELVHLHRPKPQSLLINGQMKDLPSIKVQSGRKYLFRLINANVFNCPVLFFVAKHDLDVIATDAHSIGTKITAQRIIIFPGERYDVAINTNQISGEYFVGFQGFEDCTGLRHGTSLKYDHVNEKNDDGQSDDDYVIHQEDMLDLDRNNLQLLSIRDLCNAKFDGGITRASTICSLDLVDKYARNDDASTFTRDGDYETMLVEETHYVPFDVNSYNDIHDHMTDYSFNIYDYSYYPSYLSSSMNPTKLGQVNRMTFQYPSSPILSQPEAIDDETLCSIENRAKFCHKDDNLFCQCTQILQLPAQTTADIVFVDQGFGGNVSHTFHVHGYDVGIVEVGQFDGPMEMEEILQSVKFNKRNNETKLLRKDTFIVPNKGYTIVRIHTDNIGYWLWEARSTGLYDGNNIERPPVQFLMLVGNRESLPIVPIDFPTCGDHKGPASIFEDTN